MLIWIARIFKDVTWSRGNLVTPGGRQFEGFIIKVGSLSDPAETMRTYADIDRIFKSDLGSFILHEERDSAGHFKAFGVRTS